MKRITHLLITLAFLIVQIGSSVGIAPVQAALEPPEPELIQNLTQSAAKAMAVREFNPFNAPGATALAAPTCPPPPTPGKCVLEIPNVN